MSKASDVYDAIYTVVSGLFTSVSGYRELSDPVLIDNNDEMSLAKGYSVYFGVASNTNRQLDCKYSIQRDVMITLTRAVRGTHKDVAAMKTIDKALLEDQHLLIKNFEQNYNIGTVTARRDFVTDGGIERVLGENKMFTMIQTVFQIEYFEDLN